MRQATYYVQFALPEEVDRARAGSARRWRTIARVNDRRLAQEMARLAETAYYKSGTVKSKFIGRAISRSALKQEGGWHHAEWELGIGHFRAYGEGLRAKAERNLRETAEPSRT